MKKQITATVSGNVDELLRAWSPPAGVRVQRLPGELHIVFGDEHLDAYKQLEAAAARLPREQAVDVDAFYRAVDFSKADLESSELVWLRVPATPGLEIAGQRPVEMVRCDRCGRDRSVFHQVDHLSVRASQVPTSPIVSALTLKLASRETLQGLAGERLDAGLRAVPTTITAGGRALDSDYHWISGTVDLGDPVSGIELGPPCQKCGQRPVVSNHAFLWSFARATWKNEDYCTSSFLGLDTLFVSQRVYRYLERTSVSRRSGCVFEPIELK